VNDLTHPIQLKILGKICSANGISFTNLNPDPENIERDQYNFHLQQLVKQKLIYKRNGLYRLTLQGKRLIEGSRPVTNTGELIQTFNVATLIIAVRNGVNGQEVLYQKRNRQPMWNTKQIPGGRLLLGELAEITASRRLKEEAGLEVAPDEFKLLGIMRIFRHGKNGELLSDFFYHICYCTNPRGNLIVESDFGKHSWESLEKAIKIESQEATGKKMLVQIYKSIAENKFPGFFYAVEHNNINSY
jgi:8-oxo-dGTP pyrophosphatase MutT (NUDIX family)